MLLAFFCVGEVGVVDVVDDGCVHAFFSCCVRWLLLLFMTCLVFIVVGLGAGAVVGIAAVLAVVVGDDNVIFAFAAGWD